MRNRKRFTFSILMGFFLCFAVQPALCFAEINSRYLKIAGDPLFTYYLDTETVRYIKDPYRDENLIDAWIKIVCEPDGAAAEIKNRKSKGLSTEGYDRLFYSVRRYYFRLKERQMQLMISRDFAIDGTQLEIQKYEYSAARWDDLAPSTLGDYWYGKVRGYMEKRTDEKNNQ